MCVFSVFCSGFFSLSAIDIWGWINSGEGPAGVGAVLCVFRIFSSFTGPPPLDASSTSLRLVTIKNDSRRCQVSSGEQNGPRRRSIGPAIACAPPTAAGPGGPPVGTLAQTLVAPHSWKVLARLHQEYILTQPETVFFFFSS